jgi:hypothetical protein
MLQSHSRFEPHGRLYMAGGACDWATNPKLSAEIPL